MLKKCIIVILSLSLLVGCSKDDIITPSDKMFLSEVMNIYYNVDEYLGKTIKYEGIMKSSYVETTDTTYYMVIRYGPGCCGDDENVGFEVLWDNEYPPDDAWVEAIGTISIIEEEGIEFLVVELDSLIELEERGQEYAYQ